MAILDIPQVQGFAYDLLQNDLHIGFGKDIRDRIEKVRWTDETRSTKTFPERLDAQVNPFNMAYAAEDAAFVIVSKSEQTKRRREKDAERDVLYKEIRKTVDTFATLSIFPEKQAAALKMQPVMQKYKIDPDGGIEAQTIATDQWLQEQNTNYQLELAAKELGIFESIKQLKTLNDEVRRLTSDRNDERSQKEAAALRKARTETERAYKTLMLVLNAAAVMDEDEYRYRDLILGINETIKYYRSLAEQRRKVNAAKRNKKDGDQPDPEPEDTKPADTAETDGEGATE